MSLRKYLKYLPLESYLWWIQKLPRCCASCARAAEAFFESPLSPPQPSSTEGVSEPLWADPAPASPQPTKGLARAEQGDPLEGERALSSLPLLGQMLASYLLLEADDGLILIDN